jgi:phosphocarrier protein
MPKIEKEITIMNSQGLHARPAALFVQIASKYDSALMVSKGKETVNGKSIMGILMLGAQQNSTIKLSAEGNDAEKLINELEQFLSRNE